MNHVIIGSVLVVAAFLVGCQPQGNSSSNNQNLNKGTAVTFVPCEEPRPEMCTQQYDPVCAEHTDGHYSTKSNACSACSDTSVVGVSLEQCTALPH